MAYRLGVHICTVQKCVRMVNIKFWITVTHFWLGRKEITIGGTQRGTWTLLILFYLLNWKISTCKWTQTGQTHVFQGSTVLWHKKSGYGKKTAQKSMECKQLGDVPCSLKLTKWVGISMFRYNIYIPESLSAKEVLGRSSGGMT